MIVEPEEVKTKAQPSTGRKEVWTYTAVGLVAGLRYAFAEATSEGLWLQTLNCTKTFQHQMYHRQMNHRLT